MDSYYLCHSYQVGNVRMCAELLVEKVKASVIEPPALPPPCLVAPHALCDWFEFAASPR